MNALDRARAELAAQTWRMKRIAGLVQVAGYHPLTILHDMPAQRAFGAEEMERIRDTVWPRIPGTDRPQKLVGRVPDAWLEDWITKKLKHLQETKHERQRDQRDADRSGPSGDERAEAARPRELEAAAPAGDRG